MAVRATRELGANVNVDELLAVIPYFPQYRSMTEAATKLAIPFVRIRAIVEQIADIDQPGLPGVRASEVGYRSSSDVRIRPQITVLSRLHAPTAEEIATLLLVLEIIEDFVATTSSEATQTTATKLRSALGTSVSIIGLIAAEDGRSFSFSEQIYSALHQRRMLKVRYRNVSGQVTVRELDCINIYTVESTTYLRAVNRTQEDNHQKSSHVDHLEAAEALDTPAGFHHVEPVNVRDPHAFGAETRTSEWASVPVNADATQIADYEPVFFTENEEGQEDTEDVFGQGLGPSELSAGVPVSGLAATVSFVLRRSPSVTVAESLRSENAVIT